MKYILHLLIITCLFSCTKKSEPVVIKDYINGLFTAEVNNTTFTTQKQKTGDIVVPIGYFGVTITKDQYSSSYVSILARFDEKNSCHLMFRSNNIADPTEVRIEPNSNYDNYHKGSSLTINSVRTSVTRIIVNHPRGNLKSGSYEMYNGSTLLCKGQFSSE